MARAQDRRIWIGGGAGVAALIAMAGWFGLIHPAMSATSSLRDQTGAAQFQNTMLLSRLHQLQQQSEHLGDMTASLRRSLEALPYDSGLPRFTRQVTAQAARAGVQLTAVNVGSITEASASDAAVPDDATTTTTDGSAVPASSGTTDDAAGKRFAIPVTLTSTGSTTHQFAFLRAIQDAGPRRVLVTSTQFAPPADSGSTSIDAGCTMTTQLTLFSAPLTPEQEAQLKKLLNG
jgi:hypothetical protein